MKDLNFPQMSNEERARAFRELKENDTIVEVDRGGWSDALHIRERKVVRRTPKGFIRLNNGELLKHLEYGYHIPTKEFQEWFSKIKLEYEVFRLLNKAAREESRKFKNNLEYEDALKIKEILEKILKD